jgi:hypothetical protein
MNEIKVTVTYEKPTTSKFDALMAEYEAAKKYADETVAYYEPLADVAEDAKFDAILEQLETIKEYAKKIADINQIDTVTIHTYCQGSLFKVVYSPRSNFPFTIQWDGATFSKGQMHLHSEWFCQGKYNIVGKWDEWEVYKRLENSACAQLTKAINDQKERAQKQINRLINITKGGN